MTLFSLDASDFHRVLPLVDTAARRHLSVEAVLAGAAEGEVAVDDRERPSVAVLHGPEGVYLLAGSLGAASRTQAIADYLDDWVYLQVPGGAEALVPAALPNRHMLAHPRLIFSLPLDVDMPAPLPDSYAVVREADSFGHRIFGGELEVCRCLPDVILNDRAEIGIWTHPTHRRRGLAQSALRATLAAAKASGIRQMGWHCHASNRGSIALARSVGAAEPQTGMAYSASLPAENVDDLSANEWSSLAQHFIAGSEDIAWLGFHAACAHAASGDAGAALEAVERLVADGWHGSPGWLANHWALGHLAQHPRMLAAIASLQRQKAPPG